MNIKKYVVLKDITIGNVEYAGSVSFRSIFVGCCNTLEEAEDLVRKDAPPAMKFNTGHNPLSFWRRYNNSFDIVEEFQNSAYSTDDNSLLYYILKINDTSENDEEKESLKRRNQKLEEQIDRLKKRLNSLTGEATYKESLINNKKEEKKDGRFKLW